jgi:Carboxypeptidase regulatory-like domain/TonB-dependent Receptor Plug Domain
MRCDRHLDQAADGAAGDVAMRRAIVGVLLLASGVLGAQEAPRRARIEGEIVDSVHSRPLAGAKVMAIRLAPEPAEFFGTTADGGGKFHFDTLTPGRYSVTFTSAFLDSLDLMLPPRELTIAEGETARVDMMTPSAATLREAACRGVPLPPGQGAVVGEVTDADSNRPIAGARVVVRWTEIALDRTTLKVISTPRSGFITSDSLGRYRLCGVPTNTRLVIELQTDNATGAEIALFVDDSAGVARRPLSLSVAESHAATDATTAAGADSGAPQLLRGTAALSGTVRALDGRPLADAHVRVVGAGSSAVTDSAGHFALSHLPAGSQVAEARKLGYTLGSAQVELRRGQATALDMRLTRFISLDSVHVLAQRLRYREFDDHKRHSVMGTFLDAEQITRRGALYTSDLLRTVPGVQVSGELNDIVLTSSRTLAGRPGIKCEMNVVIDGAPNMQVNMVNANFIGAMEVYVDPSTVPLQYALGSPCGAVIIWTKQ